MKFTIGYDDIQEKVKKSSRYTRCCDNCNFFYMSKDDTEEVCQNTSVLPYDVVVDDNRVYCNFWKGVGEK